MARDRRRFTARIARFVAILCSVYAYHKAGFRCHEPNECTTKLRISAMACENMLQSASSLSSGGASVRVRIERVCLPSAEIVPARRPPSCRVEAEPVVHCSRKVCVPSFREGVGWVVEQKIPGWKPTGDKRCNGAEYGIRTRDPHLGKVVLYQLSQLRVRKEVLYGNERR
jgi:hypothetical protein